MYLNGIGFRAIERSKGIDRTSIINWIKQVEELLPDAYEPDTITLVGELDELETFEGNRVAKTSLDRTYHTSIQQRPI
ncbi:hypothetical protein IQ270_21630 [Microcoleus sp. LEGE 07076]|nr:hypothetical protein [Microcoleus sp. LEGE 07076]